MLNKQFFNLRYCLKKLITMMLFAPAVLFAQSDADYELPAQISLTKGAIFTRSNDPDNTYAYITLSNNSSEQVYGQFRLVIENSVLPIANPDGVTQDNEAFIPVTFRGKDYFPLHANGSRRITIQFNGQDAAFTDYAVRLEQKKYKTDRHYQIIEAINFNTQVSGNVRRAFITGDITYTGSNTLTGPFRLVVADTNSSVINANGLTTEGEPYFNLSFNADDTVSNGDNLQLLDIRLYGDRQNTDPITYSLRVERFTNQAPYANAGVDQSTVVNNSVYLDASRSGDNDGDELNYLWSFNTKPSGSTATLSNTQIYNPTFTADIFGDYILDLIVDDGFVSSPVDQVVVSTLHSAPVANAGRDQKATIGDNITLDGSGSSDVDGDPIIYQWNIESSPIDSAATLSNADSIKPFIMIDSAGEYIIRLTVNDGDKTSQPDTVTITNDNLKPIANAGADKKALLNQIIQLNANTSYDPEGELLEYRWSLISAPADSHASLSSEALINPSIQIDKAGDYIIQLIVNDGFLNSEPDQIIISTNNIRPVANAGEDKTAQVNQTIQFDSSLSNDADNDTINYQWDIIFKPASSLAALNDNLLPNPSLVPDIEGTYIVQLIVDDGQLSSQPDTVTVDVNQAPNQPPVISSTPVTTATTGLNYTYDVQASDTDTLSYSLILSPPGMSINSVTGEISWLPTVAETVNVEVLVSDGQGGEATQLFNIVVIQANRDPVITSTPVVTGQENIAYQYQLTATDADNDTLAYSLTQLPTGMSINSTGLISWTADTAGSYPVTVQVTDGNGGQTQQSYTLVISQTTNSAPTITSTPTLNASLDAQYIYQVIASDPNSDALSYSLSTAPLGMQINNAGLITWTPSSDVSQTVTILVDDNRGGTDTQSYTVTSTGEATQTPSFNNIGNQTALLGRTFRLQLSATDPNGGALQYFAKPMPLPGNMFLRSTTGEFTFTPALTQVGDIELTFVATNGRFTAEQTITITVPAPSGITQLRGKILTENDAPLPGVRLEIGGVETTSDANGDYLLDNIPIAGNVRLLVDGSTVNPALGAFATVPEMINIIEGAENLLDPPIFLLPLDIASADPVSATQTSIVTSSRFTDGLSISEPVTLTIPPGRAIDDETGLPFEGDIHISRVTDPSKGPRPLPEEFDLSVYIAIQPFGVTYPDPVPISFPNLEGFPPGSLLDFFALNHDTGEMEKIGEGTVSADGKTVDSIGGVVRSNSWHGIVPQAPVTSAAKDENQTEPEAEDTLDSKDCAACSVDKETGNLKEWHHLPFYKSLQQDRTLRFEYNSNTVSPRPILPLQSALGTFAPPPVSMSMKIELDGIEVGLEAFTGVEAVPSGIFGQFKPSRAAIQYDASSLDTGIYIYELTTECYFPFSRRSRTQSGLTPLINRDQSPIGTGWSIAGINRIYKGEPRTVIGSNGVPSVVEVTALMLNSGTAENLLFLLDNSTFFDVVRRYIAPAGDYSELEYNRDTDIYTRTLKNGTVELYNGDGLITQSTDRNNNVTRYEYDGLLRLTAVIDPVGERFSLSYQNGKIRSTTDPLNRTTRFEHDSKGNLTAIIEPNGDRRTFEYTEERSLLAAQTDQRGNRKQYTYDTADRIKSALMPDGSITEYKIGEVQGLPDTSNGLGTRDDPLPAPPLSERVTHQAIDFNNNLTDTAVDDRNVPIRITDALGRTTSFVRDENSNPTRITRPNLSVIGRTYDENGNLLTNVEQFNGATETFTYDDFSLATSYTNPNNHTTTYNRNTSNGNVTSRVNHLGHTTTYQYNGRGLVTRMVTPNNLEVVYSYNAQSLVETITETPPAGSPGNTRITRFSYDAAGQTIQTITPDNIRINFVYDSKGRLVRTTDNLNQVTEYTYDAYDNLIQTNNISGDGSLAVQIQQVFDTRNRLSEISSPHIASENSIDKRILDNNSNITGMVDPNGSNSGNQYDAEDRLIENRHRLNGVTKYEYDTNDRITQVTAPNGVVTTYTYDVLGRRLTENSPDRGELTYTYDVNNNVLSVTDGRGITTTLTYDELERVSTKSFPNTISGKTENVTYVYDSCPFGVGRLCQRTDESGTWNYEYDAFGNIVKQTRSELGVNYITEYQYDNGDNITQMTYPTGRVVNIGRDGVRRIEQLSTAINGSNTNIVSNIQYRADNQRTQYTFGNGLVDTRQYDLQGRLTSQMLGLVDIRNYDYDKNGNILTRTTTPQTSNYAYDALDRITSDQIDGAEAFTYQYDLSHNRQSKDQTGGFTESYQYQSGSNQLIGHDAFTTGTLPDVIEDRQYIYNDANRLYQVIDDGVLKAEYIYSDNGLRTRKTVFNTSASETTVYHYDTMGYLIAETSTTGQTQKDYLWLDDMIPVAQINRIGSSDELHYLHTDHLMTPRFATNQSQQITWRWEGEAFGNTAGQDISTEINLRFPGQYFDAETNHHYNHFRYYNAEVGRYITSDRIGLNGGINTYGYVHQNTLIYTDPTGEIIPALIYAGAALWAFAELAGSAYDVYDTATTLLDPCETLAAKAAAVGLMGAGVFLPGAGYSKIDDAVKGLDLPKPPTGKGSVPPDQRDPKRVLTKKEKGDLLDERGGKCEGCKKDIDVDDARAHHIERHADGGPTTPENTAILCEDCHIDIHRK